MTWLNNWVERLYEPFEKKEYHYERHRGFAHWWRVGLVASGVLMMVGCQMLTHRQFDQAIKTHARQDAARAEQQRCAKNPWANDC